MESSAPSKTEIMKPLLLKAGIPLALSVAGFFYARIISRRNINMGAADKSKPCPLLEAHIDSKKDDEESYDHHGLDSSTVKESSEISLKEDVLVLRTRIEELQKKEMEMEMKFLQYHVKKEQELALIELKNMLVMEAADLEFLGREISSIEAEKERFQNLMVDYVRVVEAIEAVKLENRLLRRKVKEMMKKRMRIIREKKMKIDKAEAEILNFRNVVETKGGIIKKLEDELRNLQMIVDQLQEEKNELLMKLNAAEDSALSATQIDGEWAAMDDYKKLVNELEQLRQDRASESAELTYLRWTNACLKHELTRMHDEHGEIEKKEQLGDEVSDQELRDCELQKEASINVGITRSTHDSRRKRFLDKLKRWVEGGSSGDYMVKLKLEDQKEKQEIKWFGRHSVSEETEEDHNNNVVHARKSHSSA